MTASRPGIPRVVCAPNAFKGTLTAAAAAAAMARGVRAAWPEAEAVEVPVADGGDGTLEVLLGPSGGARVDAVEVSGPLGEPAAARLGWIDASTVVVELADAAGLRLLGRLPTAADALNATSAGVGRLLQGALGRGARRVIVGAGGSACTDGGAGILTVLGMRLLDVAGGALPPGGGALVDLVDVDTAALRAWGDQVAVEVACDTRAPLLGAGGAAALYAPQKGAGPADVRRLATGLERLATVAGPSLGADPRLADAPHTGAAGGCAWALAACGARLSPGAVLACDVSGLDRHLAGAALVLTGEGRLDATTATGKAPAEVLARSRAVGVPCAVVAGGIEPGAADVYDAAIALDDELRRHAGDLSVDAARAVELATATLVERVRRR